MCQGRIRRHPEELRQTAINRFRSCHNVAHLAREIGIPRQTLSLDRRANKLWPTKMVSWCPLQRGAN